MNVAITNGPQVVAQFSEGIRQIAKLSGFSERDVTRAEAGTVLKACAGRTKVAKASGVEGRERLRVLHNIGLTRGNNVTINAGMRGPAGFTWFKTKTGKFSLAGVVNDVYHFQPAWRHFRTGDWRDIDEAPQDYSIMIKRLLPFAERSVGLARQSWVQMADSIGIALEAVPGGRISPSAILKARSAISSSGVRYQNGTGFENQTSASSYFVTLTNQLPYWPKIGFDHLLTGVLIGRSRYFEQNLDHGVFSSIEKTAQAYPWMKQIGQSSAASIGDS